MVKNEIDAVLKLADTLNERVIGQRHGLEAIARRVKTSRRLDDPNKPVGVFMLCGPSGVGKPKPRWRWRSRFTAVNRMSSPLT
jgi:type VI secretion system protein VasG